MAYLHDFEEQENKVSLNAAREQAALILALYMKSDYWFQYVAELGKKDTTYLEGRYTSNSWTGTSAVLVNFKLFRQQGEYWLVIAGTENMVQWQGNLSGVFLAPGFLGTSALVNNFFLQMAAAIISIVRPKLPEVMSGVTLNISGHSLGGAAGFLIACSLKNAAPNAIINLMTFGEPRSLTENYDGPVPDMHHRIVQTDDAVTVLAPANYLFGYRYISPFTKEFGKVVALAHYGTEDWIFLDGTLAADDSDRNDPANKDRWLPATILSHFINRYCVTLHANYEKFGGDPLAEEIIDAVTLMQTGNTPTPPDGFDLSEYVDPDAANKQSFPDSPGTITQDNFREIASAGLRILLPNVISLSSLNQKLGVSDMSASGFWKVVAPINNDNYGHSASVVIQGSTDASTVYGRADTFVDYYCDLLGNNMTELDRADNGIPPSGASPGCEMMSITDAFSSRVGIPRSVRRNIGFGFSAEKGNSPADVFTTALSFSMRGVSSQTPVQTSSRTFTIIGQPDVVVRNARYDGTQQLTKIANVVTTFGDQLLILLNKLTDPAGKFGFLGVDKTVPVKSVIKFDVFSTGELLLYAPAHGYVDGDTVEVYSAPKPYKGKWKVRVATVDTFALVGSAASNSTLPKSVNVRRIKKVTGERALVFYQFITPPGGWEKDPPVIKVTKRNPARKIVPLSFKHRGIKGK